MQQAACASCNHPMSARSAVALLAHVKAHLEHCALAKREPS